MNNERHPNDDEELNEMPPQYVIDWDKVNSIQDIKLILQAVQVRFTENHPMIKNRMLENIVKVSHKKFEYSTPTSLFDSVSKEQIDNVNQDMEQARMQRLSKHRKVKNVDVEPQSDFIKYYHQHSRCPNCKSLDRKHSTKHGLIAYSHDVYKDLYFKDERTFECMSCGKFYQSFTGLPTGKLTKEDTEFLHKADSEAKQSIYDIKGNRKSLDEIPSDLVSCNFKHLPDYFAVANDLNPMYSQDYDQKVLLHKLAYAISKNSKPMDQKIAELIEKNFWDLI